MYIYDNNDRKHDLEDGLPQVAPGHGTKGDALAALAKADAGELTRGEAQKLVTAAGLPGLVEYKRPDQKPLMWCALNFETREMQSRTLELYPAEANNEVFAVVLINFPIQGGIERRRIMIVHLLLLTHSFGPKVI